MEKKITYVAKGFVLGINWFGDRDGYLTKLVKGNSIEEIETKINHMIESNVLDNGMGFKSLIGALMTIRTTTEIVVEGDRYINNKYDDNFYGSLTDEERDFLDICAYEQSINFPQNC